MGIPQHKEGVWSQPAHSHPWQTPGRKWKAAGTKVVFIILGRHERGEPQRQLDLGRSCGTPPLLQWHPTSSFQLYSLGLLLHGPASLNPSRPGRTLHRTNRRHVEGTWSLTLAGKTAQETEEAPSYPWREVVQPSEGDVVNQRQVARGQIHPALQPPHFPLSERRSWDLQAGQAWAPRLTQACGWKPEGPAAAGLTTAISNAANRTLLPSFGSRLSTAASAHDLQKKREGAALPVGVPCTLKAGGWEKEPHLPETQTHLPLPPAAEFSLARGGKKLQPRKVATCPANQAACSCWLAHLTPPTKAFVKGGHVAGQMPCFFPWLGIKPFWSLLFLESHGFGAFSVVSGFGFMKEHCVHYGSPVTHLEALWATT